MIPQLGERVTEQLEGEPVGVEQRDPSPNTVADVVVLVEDESGEGDRRELVEQRSIRRVPGRHRPILAPKRRASRRLRTLSTRRRAMTLRHSVSSAPSKIDSTRASTK